MSDHDHDHDEGRTAVDPDAFETFDHYDPDLAPPERPDEGEGEAEPASETVGFGRSVPAGTVMSAVGVLGVAYNKR